jgi:FkbM family methyltransferase
VLIRISRSVQRAWGLLISACERPRTLPSILWQVTARRAYVGELLKLYRFRQWLSTAGIATVIDVGAHHGEFATAILALLPRASVYSFEPLSEGYQRLAALAAREPRLKVFQVALGMETGPIDFWQSSFSAASSGLAMTELHKQAFPWTAGQTRVTVACAPLDSFRSNIELKPRVLLKVDVQGSEDRVFLGGLELLRSVDYVLVEVSFKRLYEREALFPDIHQLLAQNGFDFAGVMDQVFSPLDGSVLQADALFVRPRPGTD